jgi:hypothetical protein
MPLKALVVAGGLLWPACAFSQAQDSGSFVSGNDLYEKCNSESGTVSHGICGGYITGIADLLNNAGKLCIPHQMVTVRQLLDIVVKYLREHPEERNISASLLVVLALHDSFPCK